MQTFTKYIWMYLLLVSFSGALIVESLTLTINGTEYKKQGDIRRDDVRNYVTF